MYKRGLRQRRKGKIRFSILGGALIIAVFFILLISPDAAIDYMKKGLVLCAVSVIPSLFPFMIISELIVSSGIGQRISKIFSPLTGRIFGVGEAGACAYLLGTLCGFPVGARAAASMYDKGEISSRELGRVLIFCNNPSPAFVISTVGVAVLQRRDIGLLIYACVLLSSMIVGIFANIFSKGSCKGQKVSEAIRHDSIGFSADIFTSAVRSSALAMLTVCAYVVFFGTVVGCFKELVGPLGIPDIISTLLFGFFELSSGAANTGGLGSLYLSAVCCSLFCGWSGMSVHFQVMSVTAGRDVSYKPYLLAKAAQAIICAVLTAVLLKFAFGFMLNTAEDVFLIHEAFLSVGGGSLTCICFTLASVTPFVLAALKKRTKSNKNLLDKPRVL